MADPAFPPIVLGEKVGDARPPVAPTPAEPTLADLVGPSWAKVFHVAIDEARSILESAAEKSYELQNEADTFAEDLVMAAITHMAQEIVAQKTQTMHPVYRALTHPDVYDM